MSRLSELGMSVHVPQGTYFAQVSVPDAGQWAWDLPESRGVAVIPTGSFCEGPVPYARFAFCKQPDVLAEAIDRLRRHFRG